MGGRQHTSIAQPSCQQPQSWRPSWQFSPSAPTRSSLTSSSTTNPRPQRAEELARVYEDVGLGFRTPKAAIEGAYIDKKCPFTGMVSIRGRILTGTVVSTKMHRTLIIRREYLHFVPKYARYEKRHNNLAAHVSPAFRVEDGDQV